MTREEKLARAALKSAVARKELDDQIRVARAEGLSLRAIAKAVQLSPEWVRKIAASK